jgi:hypothetical protein
MLMPAQDSHKLDSTAHRSYKMHAAIRYALTYLDQKKVVNFSEFDGDGDGYVDAITFLHSGYGAEWGGIDSYNANYADRIWYVQVCWFSFWLHRRWYFHC